MCRRSINLVVRKLRFKPYPRTVSELHHCINFFATLHIPQVEYSARTQRLRINAQIVDKLRLEENA